MVLMISTEITGWSETPGELISVRMVTLESRELTKPNVVLTLLLLMVLVVMAMKILLKSVACVVFSLTAHILLKLLLKLEKIYKNN